MAATRLPPRSDPAEHSDLAVENARLRLEMQRLQAETDQRAAKLTVISAVQQGLASKLDMQAIIDLVGDKLCGEAAQPGSEDTPLRPGDRSRIRALHWGALAQGAALAQAAGAPQRAAHSLKAVSAGFGAPAFAAQCKELEEMGRAGAPEAVAGKIRALKSAYAKVGAALQARMQGAA